MKSSLYNQAVRLLARRAHSREELRRKLVRKGSTEEVSSVLDRLVGLGYLNDQEFAWHTATYQRSSKHWGSRRVRLDLKSRGLSAKIIGLTLSRLEAELPEVDGLRQLIQLWIQRFGSPTTVTQLKKLFDRCLRLGYAPEMVRSELEEHFGNLDWGSTEQG